MATTAYGRPVADPAVSRGADALLAAVEDASGLVPWARPNTALMSREDFYLTPVQATVIEALACTGPDTTAFGVPMLRFCNPDVEPIPLLQAVVSGKRTATKHCERCGSCAGGTERLLIPMGASVVAVHMCWFCRDVLNEMFRFRLVWG